MALKTRQAAMAGYFYPADKAQLTREIAHFLDQVPPRFPDKPLKALIVPHAGYRYSGQVAAYAYALLKTHPDKWKKVVAIGPAHTVMMHQLATDPHDFWETPMGRVKVVHDGFTPRESAHIREHCLEVQLPFLQYVLGDFQFLPLLAGHLDPHAFSRAVEEALAGDSLLLVSSDLSHFFDQETACEIDQATNRAIESLDYEQVECRGDACGKIPILIALDIARRHGWTCELLHYRNSGDVSRDHESVVGYASFAFYSLENLG